MTSQQLTPRHFTTGITRVYAQVERLTKHAITTTVPCPKMVLSQMATRYPCFANWMSICDVLSLGDVHRGQGTYGWDGSNFLCTPGPGLSRSWGIRQTRSHMHRLRVSIGPGMHGAERNAGLMYAIIGVRFLRPGQQDSSPGLRRLVNHVANPPGVSDAVELPHVTRSRGRQASPYRDPDLQAPRTGSDSFLRYRISSELGCLSSASESEATRLAYACATTTTSCALHRDVRHVSKHELHCALAAARPHHHLRADDRRDVTQHATHDVRCFLRTGTAPKA